MTDFIVSARKYRPETFDNVVGQEAITRTLKNAIKTGKLAHAYLFCGPRGVGKTTCARIFAKTINCQNITPLTEACNNCESCQSFKDSRSYNIHELDAASNNSVEDIRNLTDQVRVPPQLGKYSIYIIDEVHMLSASAFNAFLKTLEEPPRHAIFILATTQKEKILPTILSRCQIFDFHRIKVPDIMAHLERVAKNEGVKAEPEALSIIAQKADGAMRDALSIFDQIVSYSGKEITYARVIESLNVLDYEYYFSMTGHFLRGDVSSCLLLFNEIMDKGFDPHSFLNGLSSHFRNLLVGKDAQTLMLLEVAAGIRDRYLKQSEDCTVAFLLRCIDITNQFDIEYRNSRNQRLHVELALIRLCQANTEALQAPAQSASPEKKNADLRSHLAERAGGTGKREEVPVPEVPSGKVNEPEPPFVGPAAKKTVSRIKTPLRSSTPSIRNILKGTREEEKMAEPKEAVHEPKEIQSRSLEPAEFTLHDLQTEWMAFASSIEQAKPRMAITLKNRKLNLSEKYTISVTFDNSDQLADFNREVKQNMIDFLRQQLHNYSIQVQANVLETVHEKMIYTPEEKYEYLKTKNPRLEDLKKTFNLDFE